MGDTSATLQEISQGIQGLAERQKKIDEKLDQHARDIEFIRQKMAGAHKHGISLPGVKDEKSQFCFGRAMAVIARKDWTNPEWGFEADVLRQTASRAGLDPNEIRQLSTSTDTAGGFLVPQEYSTELIDILRAKLVTEELGATVRTNLKGAPVIYPSVTGASTVTDTAENAAATASELAFGQVTLNPHEAKGIVQVSNRLLYMSPESVDAIVREDLTKQLRLLVDLRALRGTGAANQPLGIENTTGINTTAMAGTPDADDIYAMIYEQELDNADDGDLGFAMHPRTWNSLRITKDANGNYILTALATPGNVLEVRRPAKNGILLGYPFRTTTQIPINLGAATNRSALYFGNWTDLLIGFWGGIEIAASNEAGTSFAANQTWIRIVANYDIAVRRTQSFCVDSTVEA